MSLSLDALYWHSTVLTVLLSISHIMDYFSSHIRIIAYDDSLIAGCGVALYVQEVLVPEMAMLLVKEDLGVTDVEARSILEESTEIGEILTKVIPVSSSARSSKGSTAMAGCFNKGTRRDSRAGSCGSKAVRSEEKKDRRCHNYFFNIRRDQPNDF